MAIFLKEEQKYLSANEVFVIEDGINNNNIYLVKFIKSLNPSRMPKSRLCLKIEISMMLLRNIAPRQQLCNRIQLVIT